VIDGCGSVDQSDSHSSCGCVHVPGGRVQGYPAQENAQPPRNTIGPQIVLLWGLKRAQFLMSEVPLYVWVCTCTRWPRRRC